MSICDDCKDYDCDRGKCVPTGEDAGECVVFCAEKQSKLNN